MPEYQPKTDDFDTFRFPAIQYDPLSRSEWPWNCTKLVAILLGCEQMSIEGTYRQASYVLMHVGDGREPAWRPLRTAHDTRTLDNWIDQGVVDRLGLKVESGLLQKETTFEGYTLSSNDIVRSAWRHPTLNLPHSNMSHKCEFRVVKNAPFEVLLGRNFLGRKDAEILISVTEGEEPLLVIVPEKVTVRPILPLDFEVQLTMCHKLDEKQITDNNRKRKEQEDAPIDAARHKKSWTGGTLPTGNASPTPEEARDAGYISQEFHSNTNKPTVSANSTLRLSVKQIQAIAKRFVGALFIRDMSTTSLDAITQRKVFPQFFSSELFNYLNNLGSDTSQRSWRQASELIWILRWDIYKRCEQFIRELSHFHSPNDQDERIPRVQPDEGSNDVCASELIEVLDIVNYLTTRDDFRRLVSGFEDLIQRYYDNRLESIRHCILNGIQRQQRLHEEADKYHIAFCVEWGLIEFLEDQYGQAPELGSILTITGCAKDAQLTTARAYLKQTWPTHPWELLDSISSIVNRDSGDSAKRVHNVQNDYIFVDQHLQRITVHGTSDFIVTIAQQLAWMVAAFRVSPAELAYSYVSLYEKDIILQETFQPAFQITSEVVPLSKEEPKSCWNDLVGNSVIVENFPILERLHSESGLEIPLEIMAGLGGTTTAVQFGGGYIIKGALMVFVPVKRISNSVQWHLVQKTGERIRYNDVLELCPNRLLLEELGENDLLSTKAFLGWCRSSINNIATTFVSASEVGYSQTNRLSGQGLTWTGLTIGFSKVVTGALTFSPGKTTAPYTADKPKFYKDMLEDAKKIHVILHDTKLRRAWQTDAERAILHIILHLQSLGKLLINGETVTLRAANGEDPSSVRTATSENEETAIARDQHIEKKNVKEKLFRDLFLELYDVFEGLQATTQNTKPAGIKLKTYWTERIQGYEYMNVVERSRTIFPKEAELQKTCGNWPSYARDIEAVVLFGTNFGELFMPAQPEGLCRLFQTMPTNNDYLAVEVSVLRSLQCENCSSKDREQITATGMRWYCSQHIFEPCQTEPHNKSDKCSCDRIQRFSPKYFTGSTGASKKLEGCGVVIFGQKYSGIVGLNRSISSVLLGENKAPTAKVPETLPTQNRETDNQIIYLGDSSSNSTPSSSVLSGMLRAEEPGNTKYPRPETDDQLNLSPQKQHFQSQFYSSPDTSTSGNIAGVVTRESSNTNDLDSECVTPAEPQRALNLSSPPSLTKTAQLSDFPSPSGSLPNQQNYQEEVTDLISKASMSRAYNDARSVDVSEGTNDMNPPPRRVRRKPNFQR